MKWVILFIVPVTVCCNAKNSNGIEKDSARQSIPVASYSTTDSNKAPTQPPLSPRHNIETRNVTPEEVVAFAKTLIGTPYKYASTDPSQGFDCSGFITYVFNHFEIAVPRSSIDFTNVNETITVEAAKPGDLILFTGTDSTSGEVGHMGIVVNSGEPLQFIHSTSGKQYGVTITPLNNYYKSRFVKLIRVFQQNNER